MFRALSLISVFLFQQHIYAAAPLSQCDAYLYQVEIIKGESLFENTLSVLKEYQVTFRQTQFEALKELRGRLRERSVDVGIPFVTAVPAVLPETLDRLKAWESSTSEDDMDMLKSWISDDPYLKWLEKNWTTVTTPDDEVFEDSFLTTSLQNDGAAVRIQDLLDVTTWGYFNRHLKFTGPMKLRPELAIFRVMRDHDPKLGQEEEQLIDHILGYEQQMYVLNTFVRQMENFAHGSIEEWDRYDHAKEVNRRLQELKLTLREWFPDYKESAFIYDQTVRSWIRNASGENPMLFQDLRYSFEDYIVEKAGSTVAFDKEFMELKEEYFRLKAILYALAITDNVATLNEELAVQIQSLRSIFLY